ncbi:hypothetical protein GCM10008020_41750 [Massilia psychrophila]|nr:hypothetical protein GCM10008020_41750 [Massilia psychrophila]
MANAPAFFKGVINLRGVIVPVLDMRIKFNLGNPTYDAFTIVIVLNGTVNLTKSQKIFRLKVGISLLFFEKFSDLSNIKVHENHEEWGTLKVSSLS